MFRLVIRDAEGGEASFPIMAPLTIGRSHSCEIRLFDDSVSRRHARVFLDYGDPAVEDLSTPNGTMVNGEKIHGSVRLRAGDVIQVAHEKIRVIETSALEDFAQTTRIVKDGGEVREAEGPPTPWREPIEPRARPKYAAPESEGEDEGKIQSEGADPAGKKPSKRLLLLIGAGFAILVIIVIFLVVNK
jgi:pSer/pThr/pTyr-binding forkhead associated (FHA) protein